MQQDASKAAHEIGGLLDDIADWSMELEAARGVQVVPRSDVTPEMRREHAMCSPSVTRSERSCAISTARDALYEIARFEPSPEDAPKTTDSQARGQQRKRGGGSAACAATAAQGDAGPKERLDQMTSRNRRADVEDRWHKIIRNPDGTSQTVPTVRNGTGLRWMARWVDAEGRDQSSRSRASSTRPNT
jgi:hypothetical protein